MSKETPEIINVEGEVIKEKNKKKSDRTYKKLSKFQEEDKRITDIVTGSELLSENGPVIASLFIDDYRVIIPYNVFLPENIIENTRNLKEAQFILSKRLGSEIDFKIVGIDKNEKIVVADRVSAMKEKKEDIWFRKYPDADKYLINKGSILEGRIVNVAISWLIIEVFGIEKKINVKDVSHIRISDLRNKFSVGDRAKVRVTEIKRDEENKDVDVSLSIKDVRENPVEDIIGKINVGDVYIGEVTMIMNGNVFLSINDDFEVLCKLPSRGRSPVVGGKANVVITNINKEQLRVFGVITNVSTVF